MSIPIRISVANPMHTGAGRRSSIRDLAGVMDSSSVPFSDMDQLTTAKNPVSNAGRESGSKSSASQGEKRSGWCSCLRRAQLDTHRKASIHEPELQYGDNFISTSKYTLLTFIPRSLFEQFRRIANVYFLGISILMLLGTYVPELFQSPLSAYSTLGPLCLVLFITMVKEGAEDSKRHRSDYTVNNRLCTVIGKDGRERQESWKSLRVGMVIKVDNKNEVPADIILLQTSEPRSICYIETSNIDGETNLKLKEGLGPTAAAIHAPADVARVKGEIEYEGPNDRIHTFTGKIRVNNGGYVPVGARNMVLRGCTLRNTKWVLGLIVYSGRDTKVMKKSGGARSKMSQVEKTMNMCIKVIFGAQFVLCTIATIALVLWDNQWGDDYPYLLSSATTTYLPKWLGQWFTFLILFNNFIPISLYVTVEMVNYAQAWLIDRDVEMHDPVSDTPAKARTSNLNQDLGQIEYVFSDKTGTLTRNVMEFKQCSVAGAVYGTFVPEADADENELRRERREHEMEEASERKRSNAAGGCFKRKAATIPPDAIAKNPVRIEMSSSPPMNQKKEAFQNPFRKVEKEVVAPVGATTSSGFDDPVLREVLLTHGQPGYGSSWTPETTARAAAISAGAAQSATHPDVLTSLEAFFTCMAVCHTVVPEVDDKAPEGPPIFQAESPDEGALAKAARDIGFEFVTRNADHIIVHRRVGEQVQPLKFMIHGVHEFNSTRKRMAVVAQNPDGRYFLMVKGADNVIFERSHTEPYRRTLEEHLRQFASVGLRTLVLAQREMQAAEFQAWQADYHDASVAMSDREGKLTAVAEKYEKGLFVLGATAIEDRLQEGVPGTIRDLARAGIKTWVLTGDKVETAINIGFSCRLLDASMELIHITAEEDLALRHQLAALEQKFLPMVQKPQSFLQKLTGRNKPVRTLSETVLPPVVTADSGKNDGTQSIRLHTDMAVIVTGPALTHILGHADLESAFLTIARCCRAVVACRVSPQQKALIVKLVRKGISPSPMTLAIGDGANDVGMIQRAEVGVGISGKEGLQAVNSADFAIAQFRFLRRLLLVHGRWDYRRMAKVVLYSFYKNVVITLSLFYYTALTGFSGTSFYESNVYSTYNFVLGLPIIFAGILDRDIAAKTALDHPSVYAVGLKHTDLNFRKILTWIWWAVLHSVIVFWLVYGIMGPTEVAWATDGTTEGLSAAGLTQFNVLVWAMQFEVCMQTISWTWVNYFVLALSMGLFYAFLIAYSQLYSVSPDFYGVALRAFGTGNYWLVIILMFGLMAILDYTTEVIRRMYFPAESDIAMERDRGYGTPNTEGYIQWEDDIADEKKASPSGITAINIGPADGMSPKTYGSIGSAQPLASTTVTGTATYAAGAYRDYVDVPKEVVFEGSSPKTMGGMGVSDAKARTGFDYTYANKMRSPTSPLVE